ncbi:putative protein phosphatase 2C 80 [Canna indica]|uniref:Protein phosphatase n=1 Tax=Canna indica TaxID=4628 RepID=A0AAQ3JPU6_9LILI|nr:putative protein phosphatase 2C 80 [Canna indica]
MMAAIHFSSKKVIRSSLELFGRNLPGLLAENIGAFRIVDGQPVHSFAGSVARVISVPSLTSPSCHSCSHNINSLILESIRSWPSTLFERTLASVRNPLSYGLESVAYQNSGNSFTSLSRFSACALYPTTSIDYCRRVCEILRSQELWGSGVDCKSFWIVEIGKHLFPNPSLGNGIKELCSSLFTSCRTGAAADMSLVGSQREEHLDNSSSSSDTDQKKSSERELKLLSGSCYLPHPDKEETGGDDAHFIWDERAIGVADGVGGWADLGIDSGQYSRALMSNSVDAIEEEPKGSIDPLRVLEKAYSRTKAKGSSTACIVALTDQGIHAINLGDSGFVVVRDGCTIFRSPVQQHDFNFTYQLECDNASDLPSAAQVFTFPVESGDVIVAGTDGLFDNLYNNEITAVVVHGIRAGLSPQVMAQKIAALARQRAQDKNRQTPFSTAAQDAGYRYYGGKLDDITVVVSFVTAFGS